MPRTAALLLALCPAVFAQTTLEIRGTVLELGSDGAASLPVNGAEVSLIEFVHVGPNVARSPFATAYTDPRGEYLFHPDHTGDYWVEVKKEGYRYTSTSVYGAAAKLDAAHSVAQSTFTLVRAGASITGRVVDEDGRPVPNLRVMVQGAGPAAFSNIVQGGDAVAVTAADGTFTAADMLPGPKVVRISSVAGEQAKIEPHFSPEDLKTVDQEVETTYWPGGTPQPAASIAVSPGGSVSIGTIAIRKVPLYRAHVSVSHVDCEAGEKWIFRALYSGEVSLNRPAAIPCAGDFLVSHLRPGAYSFMLQKDSPAPAQWALASTDISSKNIEVALTLARESQINGRVVAAKGAAPPPLDKIKVSTRSLANGPAPASLDAEGKFVLTNLKFPSHKIVVAGLTKDFYVMEIRLGGKSVPDDTVTLTPGAANQLEIVIDDKPGVISGTVADGGNPAAGAEVMLYPKVLPAGLPISLDTVRTDAQGRFQIAGLTPGEYRIVAWRLPAVRRPGGYGDILPQLADQAETIRVERGGTSTVSLKLTDPSR
jgi:hypothetical protein